MRVRSPPRRLREKVVLQRPHIQVRSPPTTKSKYSRSRSGLLYWSIWRWRQRECLDYIVCAQNPFRCSSDDAHSGYLTAVLREIRRLGSGFSQVDSVILKKSQQGASTVDAPGSVLFEENGVDLGKPRPQTSDLEWRPPCPADFDTAPWHKMQKAAAMITVKTLESV